VPKDGIEVPYDVIDKIILAEHQKQALSYSIYIINTPVIGQGHPYWFTSKSSLTKDSMRKECGTSLWIGEERYVWVDLSAGPVTFGPILAGEGVVTSAAIPRVDSFKTATSFASKDFIADLAAFVSRTCEHVFLPPVKWYPVQDSYVMFTVVHITKDNGKADLPFNWIKLQPIV